MTVQGIPDETVEAAARELQMEDGHSVHFSRYLRMAQLALEATATHLQAAAWDEGVSHGFDLARNVTDPAPNPYRSQE